MPQQCPQPCSRPLLTHPSAADSWHSQASLGQSLVMSLLLFSGSWCTQGFVHALQESVSPVPCKFCNQIPLASKVKFPLPDPQVGKSVVGPRTFLTVWEFLCYNCSAVYGSSAQWLYGEVNGNFQEGLCNRLCDQVASLRALAPAEGHCWPVPLQETQTHVWLSLWGLVHTRFCLSPLNISHRYGVWF